MDGILPIKRLGNIQMDEGAESILYACQKRQTFCLACRSPEVQYFQHLLRYQQDFYEILSNAISLQKIIMEGNISKS